VRIDRPATRLIAPLPPLAVPSPPDASIALTVSDPLPPAGVTLPPAPPVAPSAPLVVSADLDARAPVERLMLPPVVENDAGEMDARRVTCRSDRPRRCASAS
jgi:hypothetical protein